MEWVAKKQNNVMRGVEDVAPYRAPNGWVKILEKHPRVDAMGFARRYGLNKYIADPCHKSLPLEGGESKADG